MIEELRKIKIEEIEQEITRLSEMKLEQKKYNWLERNIFKVAEYKEEQSRIKKEKQQIKEKITKLLEKKEKFLGIKYIQGFETTIEEAIKLMEEKGITPVLKESDFTDVWMEDKPNIDNLGGLILVHKTDYAPIDSKIKSAKESKSYTEEPHIIAGHQIPIKIYKSRNTVHFAVNGEVSSHFGGNWEEKKYAILVPFLEIPKEKYACVSPEDTYTIGGVSLTPNSWVLVPKGEKDLIKKNNPNINVIEYEGKNVTKYADQLIKMLGYSIQSIDAHGWRNSDNDKKYTSNMISNGYKLGIHSYSEYAHEERFETYMQAVVQMMQYVNEHLELLDEKNFLTEVTEFFKKNISLACQKNLNPQETILDIRNFLLSYSFDIPEEKVIKFYKICQDSIHISNHMTKEIIDLLKTYKEETKDYNCQNSR